jgi:phthiocerol/phenolphthiocerol synthesis type-I polyketide synthase E
MNSAPSVIMLSPEYPPYALGGLATHVHDLAKGLVAAGHRVFVFSVHPGVAYQEDARGLTVRSVAVGAEDDFASVNRRVAAAAEAFLESGEKPDLIHSHDVRGFPAAQELQQRYRIPLVSTFHLLLNPISQWWGDTLVPEIGMAEAKVSWESDAVMVESESMKAAIVEAHGVNPEKVTVVFNGLNLSRLITSERPAAASRRVIFAARLDPQKGAFALLRSAIRVAEDLSGDVQYLLVGSGRQEQAIKQFASEHPALNGIVTFEAHMSLEDLANRYSQATLAVIPSVYEPFGYVALEAMASGVPVVATRTGGLGEIIEDGITGLLVPLATLADGTREPDVEALAAAQVRLLKNPEFARELARAALVRVRARYSLAQMIDGTVQVYRGLLS